MSSKPLNSFFLFCVDKRAAVAESNPELTNAEVTSLIAKKWKELDPKIKTEYRTRSKKDNEVSSKVSTLCNY